MPRTPSSLVPFFNVAHYASLKAASVFHDARRCILTINACGSWRTPPNVVRSALAANTARAGAGLTLMIPDSGLVHACGATRPCRPVDKAVAAHGDLFEYRCTSKAEFLVGKGGQRLTTTNFPRPHLGVGKRDCSGCGYFRDSGCTAPVALRPSIIRRVRSSGGRHVGFPNFLTYCDWRGLLG